MSDSAVTPPLADDDGNTCNTETRKRRREGSSASIAQHCVDASDIGILECHATATAAAPGAAESFDASTMQPFLGADRANLSDLSNANVVVDLVAVSDSVEQNELLGAADVTQPRRSSRFGKIALETETAGETAGCSSGTVENDSTQSTKLPLSERDHRLQLKRLLQMLPASSVLDLLASM